jgi:hypothetical protein
MKSLFTMQGREFVLTGPKSICGRKVAGKWDGKGRTTWINVKGMYSSNPKK